jgi:hypothetical protein
MAKKAKPDDALKAFHDGFVAELPPGAEAGSYAASAHDRFHDLDHGIEDGRHEHGDWIFQFAGGRFVDAVHKHRAAAILGDSNG